jgi:hypothetical protein
MPFDLALGRLAETSFWVFAAAGILWSRNTPSGTDRTLHLGWADVATLVVVVIGVRIVAGGIAFQG